MSAELQQQRTHALIKAHRSGESVIQPLTTKGVSFGQLSVSPDGLVNTQAIEGVDHDLVIRPFSHKGVMTSLRQFTVNALNLSLIHI